MKSTINSVLLLSFAAAIGLLLVSSVWAIGLGVNPGEINIENVPLGKKVAVSVLGGKEMKLRIENKSNSAYTYTINVLTSFETRAVLKEGYMDIPDTSWIWPEKKEVSIAGKSSKAVELYLKIPKSEEYYNKKYQAIIEVISKHRPRETFVLACQLLMRFSTYAGEKEEQD